jgi:hypothetical protein
VQDSLVHPVGLCVCFKGRFDGIKITVQKGIQFGPQKQGLSKPLFVKRYYLLMQLWPKIAHNGYFQQITAGNWGVTSFQHKGKQ